MRPFSDMTKVCFEENAKKSHHISPQKTSCPRDCFVFLSDAVASGKLGVNFEFYFHLTSHISTIFKCCPFYLLSAPQFHFYKTFCHHSGPGHHLLYGQSLWPSLPASIFDLGTPKYAQICQGQAPISKCLLDNASWRYTSTCHFQVSSWGTCVLDWVPDLMSHTLVKHEVILSNSPSPPSRFCLGNFLYINPLLLFSCHCLHSGGQCLLARILRLSPNWSACQ